MNRGKAIGGPLNGIMLESSLNWSGVIRGRTDGRYTWSTEENTWMWTRTDGTRREKFIHGTPNRGGPAKTRTYIDSDGTNDTTDSSDDI